MTKKTRRRFSYAFKAEAVSLVIDLAFYTWGISHLPRFQESVHPRYGEAGDIIEGSYSRNSRDLAGQIL